MGEKSGKSLYIMVSVLILAGAALFLYPAVSSYLAELNQVQVIESYDQILEELDERDYSAYREKAVEYNESLLGEPVKDPFLEGSGMALPENYMEVLNMDDNGVMGTVEIPKISVSLPIYHGTEEEVLEKGAGHIRQTALPIGGAGNHAVLTGHTGLPHAKLFDNLSTLKLGDQFYIHILDEILAYQVDAINVVLPNEVELLDPIPGEDHITLITCTPYGVNSHRLLVRGMRVDYIEEVKQKEEQEAPLKSSVKGELLFKLGLIGIVIFALLLVLLVVKFRKKDHVRITQRNKGDHNEKEER